MTATEVPATTVDPQAKRFRAVDSSSPILDKPLQDHLARLVVASPNAESATVLAPFTGGPIGSVPVSTPDDVGIAFETARRAQRDWASLSVHDRERVLLRLHDLILARRDEALDLVQWESGKARKHALEEVIDVAITARYYGRRSAGFLGTKRRAGVFPLLTSAQEIRHPKGVVGIISPWNYPLTLAISDAIPALAAGNTVVLKPDLQSTFTALFSVDLLIEAGVPEQVIQVVVGDGPVIGPAVVDHADYVCFTGSTRTGRGVAERAAARLIGCSLELGGKNPLLILDDADLDRAVEGSVRACFSSAGQLCISTERVLVHDAVYESFVSRFVQAVEGMRLTSGLDYSADMGSLVSERQLEVVTRHVESAKAAGATVLTGGNPRPDVGPLFFEPTVLSGVSTDAATWCEETFGPVVSVRRVASEDEAIELANDSEYGLNASVWTRDVSRGRRLAERIKAGTVNINEAYAAAWGSVDAPMGGMKDSGLGRRHGAEGILKYTEPQTVASQRLQGFGKPAYMSDEQWEKFLVISFSAMKKLGRR